MYDLMPTELSSDRLALFQDATVDKELVTEMRVACTLNAAMCCIKEGQWPAAIAHGTTVLGIEPKNVKALYRCGLACSNAGRLGEAKVSQCSLRVG
jgi:hypothetical protein